MTKNERRAAMDAIAGILGQQKTDEPQGPTGPQLPPEFIDAWNKILQKYDDDNIPDSELLDILDQILTGKLTSL